MKLLSLFRRKKFYPKAELFIDGVSRGEVTLPMPSIPQGGVRKVKHKQWSLDQGTGGRIVKTMPRNLRHMKEISEKTDE
jgi:hypothetical protein